MRFYWKRGGRVDAGDEVRVGMTLAWRVDAKYKGKRGADVSVVIFRDGTGMKL